MKKISILFMLLLGITSLYAQQFNITGTVIDKKLNEPIIGATVQVKGTNNGTVTNLDGEFALKNVAKGSVLNVSYIGYVTQSISLNGAQTSFRIELSEDSKTLDEVVVVGFGTQKKVNNRSRCQCRYQSTGFTPGITGGTSSARSSSRIKPVHP